MICKLRHIIFLISTIVVLYSCTQANNWFFSLRHNQKNPYDCYLAYNALPLFFKQATIIQGRETFSVNTVEKGAKELKIIILKELELSYEENSNLIYYLNKGGKVFISANDMQCDLLQKLKMQYTAGFDMTSFTNSFKEKNDTLIRNINIDTITQVYRLNNTNYTFKGNYPGGALVSWDSRVTVDTLGYDGYGKVNFIKIKFGKGELYLHYAPVTFTNYFLTQQNNKTYLSNIYAYFGKDISKIYWYSGVSHIGYDYNEDMPKEDFHLSVLFRYPMLKYAILLLFTGILLYIVFNGKRKQRAVPIILPLQNTTVDFVETLGNLYYNMSDHKNLAEKMINHFWEHIRTKYNLVRTNNDVHFNKKLSVKTGVPLASIEELMGWFEMVRTSTTMNEQNLLKLYNKLQYFYNNAK